MQLYRITFQVDGDEVSDVVIESTKGCPQCDAGASHDDLPDHPDGGVGEAFAGEDRGTKSTSSIKPGRDGAGSASSS